MVNGLDRFREHFAAYADRYVLIGGTASSVAMEELGEAFHRPATRRPGPVCGRLIQRRCR